MVDQACKFLIITDYHLWGPVDARILQDPQWWRDAFLWFRLRAIQRQPMPDWVQEAMSTIDAASDQE
jgi:hypothetical protein